MPVKSAQSFRDRTQEFQSIAEKLKKSFSSGAGPNGPSSSSKAEDHRSAVAMQSEFNRRASKIGFGIHQTSLKLSKLAKCKLTSHCHLSANILASVPFRFVIYINDQQNSEMRL